MQAHVRHVEKFTNFMSPVGLHMSHYNSSHPSRKRQRFNNLTNPPNVTGDHLNLSAGSGSESDHETTSANHASHSHPHSQQHPVTVSNVNVNRVTNSHPHSHHGSERMVNISTHHQHHHHHNDDMKQSMSENQWARENLSLRHQRNRSMYFDADTSSSPQAREIMNSILDKLVIYGYETSADIAKMQPWQLRVLKKEIPQIDFIFMTAYRMWGKQEYYDDRRNLAYRQYWDPAVWLQYNEIELIIKCFDAPKRGYRCMICGTTHGLYELDQVRWHIWLEHKESTDLNAIMQSSRKYNDFHKPLNNLQLPSLNGTTSRGVSPNTQQEKAQPQVISLLDDSTDDEMEVKPQRRSTSVHSTSPSRSRYTNKARQYNSRRRNSQHSSMDNNNHNSNSNNNNNSRRRRSRRLANKQSHDDTQSHPQPIHHPIIINGANQQQPQHQQHGVVEIHGSASPAFMPSAQFPPQPTHTNNGSTTILDTMNTMKNDSTFSLDTNMEMDDEYQWNDNDQQMNNDNLPQHVQQHHMDDHNGSSMNNNNGSPDMQMDEFNMIGFNDDFSTLGVMGALSRNSSDSLNLNSAFTDPNFSFQSSKF